MAKDYNVLAKSIVELVGGEENVVSLWWALRWVLC